MREHREPVPQPADANERLIVSLRDLSHVMRSLYEGKGSQTHILIVLDDCGGAVTQRELTQRLGIQSGSASEVIAKLESAGYIQRKPSQEDRRTADIVLTETGRAAAAEARDRRLRRHEEMFSCLTGEEKDQLLTLLDRVSEDWRKRYQDSRECRGRHGHPHGGRRHPGRHREGD